MTLNFKFLGNSKYHSGFLDFMNPRLTNLFYTRSGHVTFKVCDYSLKIIDLFTSLYGTKLPIKSVIFTIKRGLTPSVSCVRITFRVPKKKTSLTTRLRF